eukprot:scaffold3995_cov45-Cylindrotheca_fusiformis.AAC.1
MTQRSRRTQIQPESHWNIATTSPSVVAKVSPLVLEPLKDFNWDCDNDHDCESGLVCFQRDENESVPGCSGGSSDGSRTDYCIVPSNKSDSTSSSTLPLEFSHNFPLGRCE